MTVTVSKNGENLREAPGNGLKQEENGEPSKTQTKNITEETLSYKLENNDSVEEKIPPEGR